MSVLTAFHGRLGRFAVIGIAAAMVYVCLAWLLTVVAGLPATIASFAAYGLAATFSYLGQRFVTFRSDRPHREAAPRFLGLTLIGYAIAVVVPLIVTDGMGARPELAILVTSVIVPIVTYVGLERLVFAGHRPERPGA